MVSVVQSVHGNAGGRTSTRSLGWFRLECLCTSCAPAGAHCGCSGVLGCACQANKQIKTRVWMYVIGSLMLRPAANCSLIQNVYKSGGRKARRASLHKSMFYASHYMYFKCWSAGRYPFSLCSKFTECVVRRNPHLIYSRWILVQKKVPLKGESPK